MTVRRTYTQNLPGAKRVRIFENYTKLTEIVEKNRLGDGSCNRPSGDEALP